MARPSGNADRLMLSAARKIAGKEGCTGLRIRDVTRRAGVNLGMFHYHFKNRKRFTRALLQELYEEFFAKLSAASREGVDAYSQLKGTLLVFARFTRDERGLFGALIKDLLNGDPEVLRFVRENVPRHMAVLRDLFERAQREGSLGDVSLPQAFAFFMSAMNGPNLMGGLVEKVVGGIPRQMHAAFTDAAIEQRVEWALGALRVHE